jgi:hypothetical protein
VLAIDVNKAQCVRHAFLLGIAHSGPGQKCLFDFILPIWLIHTLTSRRSPDNIYSPPNFACSHLCREAVFFAYLVIGRELPMSPQPAPMQATPFAVAQLPTDRTAAGETPCWGGERRSTDAASVRPVAREGASPARLVCCRTRDVCEAAGSAIPGNTGDDYLVSAGNATTEQEL